MPHSQRNGIPPPEKLAFRIKFPHRDAFEMGETFKKIKEGGGSRFQWWHNAFCLSFTFLIDRIQAEELFCQKFRIYGHGPMFYWAVKASWVTTWTSLSQYTPSDHQELVETAMEIDPFQSPWNLLQDNMNVEDEGVNEKKPEYLEDANFSIVGTLLMNYYETTTFPEGTTRAQLTPN